MTTLRIPALALVFVLMASLPLLAEETAEQPKSVATYSLDYCIVSGEKLGAMGEPVVKTYDGREVKFCCNDCVKTFEKDRAKWTKKLDDAVSAAQRDDYPLETCVVSGEKLGGMGAPTEYVYQNRLVRFCCDGCIKTFNKDPQKYLAMLYSARAHSEDKPMMKDMHGHEGMGH